MRKVDVVIVGAGAAGLSLAWRLAGPGAPAGGPRVALVEPPPGGPRTQDRTWCFWEPEPGEWDAAVGHRWPRVSVIGPDGAEHAAPIAPLVYKMVRSRDYAAHVEGALPAERVTRVAATVYRLSDGADHATVHAIGANGRELRIAARWVFDSRPPPRPPAAATTLLQHFRGWFVHTERDSFRTDTAVLMDLRPPQPPRGVAFGYLLPFSPRTALVEYTQFTREVLDDSGYDAGLSHYLGSVLGIGDYTVTGTEQGVIPMTDAHFPRRAGRRILRIGAAGGATRPATGYTFAALQRQTAATARALAAGRAPVPPLPHRRRHLLMDAVLLRALDTGRLDGARFFAGLFARRPVRQVLDFLDGRSTPAQEIAIGLHTPVLPMSLTTAEVLVRSIGRRGRVTV
ncbi:lycopene cyclase family protein [Allonocardiopsis opalescens]|uniref:Lycopene beta-cyclase n=1 Tax=Allonocardiopsis opalescens TaxID=1144618 RepID=A0A2T0QE99_9ACTN|nr:lycopene cyclase family protein [Allonocardiopsis opalescens]PRY02238.1 lycopene beta-cyclase [Allonocardiopsis opalescens]